VDVVGIVPHAIVVVVTAGTVMPVMMMWRLAVGAAMVMVMVFLVGDQGLAVASAVGWLKAKDAHGLFELIFELVKGLAAEGAVSRALFVVVVVIMVVAP